jgi:hypothetical protein
MRYIRLERKCFRVEAQFVNSKDMVGDCLESLSHSYGLLCKYVLGRDQERSTPVPIDSMDSQWHLMLKESMLNINSSTYLTEESPRMSTMNCVQDFKGNLTDALIPTFLSLWEEVTENPVQEVANPNTASNI